MLNVIKLKGVIYVSLAEFYDYVKGDPVNYARWTKNYVTERPDKMASELIDFIDFDSIPVNIKQNGRGHLRKDYLISIDFLKQLCVDIKTVKCKEIKDWAMRLH